MALIWSKKTKACLYEVRTAGNSVRLYNNRTFHSQWNPARPLSGNVWDMLFYPACLIQPVNKIQRVLVLGVGGGAVINLLNHFVKPKRIIAVDLDATHLRIAKKFFLVEPSNTALVLAEAETWLKGYGGPKFDLIIEDLFAPSPVNGEPIRAIDADATWFGKLTSVLSQKGVLVMNFESQKQFGKSEAKKVSAKLGFCCAFSFTTAHYDNAIVAFDRQNTQKKQFLDYLYELPRFNAVAGKLKLKRYRCLM